MLDTVVREAADPAWARVVVDRLAHGDEQLDARLRSDERLARAVVSLADASRSLTEAVLRDVSLLTVVDDLVEIDPDLLDASALAAVEPHLPGSGGGGDPREGYDALRRWKRREMVRIALRDLLGLADLATVARNLSQLADACLRAAFALAAPDVPMAVIGMGKLGGRELNYASDVDVVFVHEGDEFAATRAARRLITAMASPTAEGIVFRTDADLRPDGKAGPLSRTVNAYAAYYRERALTWERQALIKTRLVAGDPTLAAAYFDAVLPTLWEGPLPADAVRDIHAMKARAEGMLLRNGLYEREVKRGRGGIRDVEFAVQLLQFVHGRHDKAIRSSTTLDALDQLARNGYVDAADAEHLAVAYRYLRTVEHRLQLEREQQVYALPAEPAALERLARVLGYRDNATQAAVEQFEATHRRHQASVRSIHERLFFRPLLEALAGSRPLSAESLADQLAAFGFADLAATRAAVEELTMGMSRNAIQLRVLFPRLLEWFSNAPNPDLGLLQLRIVLDGPVRAMTVVPVLRESPVAAERLCRVLGSSKLIGQAIRRQPEFISELADGDGLAVATPSAVLAEEALETLRWRADAAGGREDGLRRFKRRAELRVAARDVLGLAGPEQVGEELTAIAEAALAAEVTVLEPTAPFVVIGMGKLGGSELGYSSDLDVLFVHDGERPPAEALAARLLGEVGALTSEGRAWEIDARLRPEGKDGLLSRSLDGYREYYESFGALWERQALIKARVVAGDAGLGAAFLALRDEVTYGKPLTAADVAEILRMKGRVQRERLHRGEVAERHLKLGPGGLADIEFTVQLLQLLHGPTDVAVRSPGTLAALRALQATGHVADGDAAVLASAYRFCVRARNALHLRGASNADQLPAGAAELRDLDRLLLVDATPGVEEAGGSFRTASDRHRALADAARVVIDRLSAEAATLAAD